VVARSSSRVPPLRERPEDIPLLTAHFVRRFAERQGKKVEEIPDDVIATLKHHSWPGNVRELQNVIERAVVATTGPTLRLSEPQRRKDRGAASSRTLAQVERDHIVATLQTTNWVLGGWDGAAARLGLSRTTLISRMQRLGISTGSGLRKSASQPAVSRVRVARGRTRRSSADRTPGQAAMTVPPQVPFLLQE
jgi:DNA-binding NtrC family response regulator